MQRGAVYAALGLPPSVRARTMSDEVLGALVGLHRELARRAQEAIATPEEARRANTELRQTCAPRTTTCPRSRARRGSAEGRRPRHRRAHPPFGEPAGGAPRVRADLRQRPAALHPLGHRPRKRTHLPAAGLDPRRARPALDGVAGPRASHPGPPRAGSYAEFLRQRLEINYFAAACLMPQKQSVDSSAPKERNLAIEDFRDAFGVTHEAAALRFTNLGTVHLGMTVHFLRVNKDGSLQKGYENDGLLLPTDVTGATEGQFVCRHWGARGASTTQPHDRVLPVHRYPRPARTGAPPRSARPPRRSSRSPSGCRSPTRSGSGDGSPPTARAHAVPTAPAAGCRTPRSPRGGRTRRGRAPGCTRTSCPRCRREPSPVSMTPSFTRSWTLTRASGGF